MTGSATRGWTPLLLALLVAPSVAWAQPPAPPDAPTVSEERIRAALLRYRHEPTVARVVTAAVASHGHDPERARRAATRARRRGWVPDVRVSLRRGQGRDLSLRAAETDANVSTDDDLTLQAWLRFDLDRVVFSSQEVALMREERARRERRAELVRLVVALYFERRRLQLERDLLGHPDAARAVRIMEIEALLDVFTDGAFGRMMTARSGERR